MVGGRLRRCTGDKHQPSVAGVRTTRLESDPQPSAERVIEVNGARQLRESILRMGPLTVARHIL